jgi:hypothetical protein
MSKMKGKKGLTNINKMNLPSKKCTLNIFDKKKKVFSPN